MPTTTPNSMDPLEMLGMLMMSLPATLFLIFASVVVLVIAHGLLGFTLSCIKGFAEHGFGWLDFSPPYDPARPNKKERMRMDARVLRDHVSASLRKDETRPLQESFDTALPGSDTSHVYDEAINDTTLTIEQDQATKDAVNHHCDQDEATKDTTNNPTHVETPASTDAKANEQYLLFFLALATVLNDILNANDAGMDYFGTVQATNHAITILYILRACAPTSVRNTLKDWHDQLNSALRSIAPMACLPYNDEAPEECVDSLVRLEEQVKAMLSSTFEEGELGKYADLRTLYFDAE
ncbi:hypothetical protein LTR17_000545 [Elasticomyces elasticus]|nr:hypothetical protein LTR17_000545 [Elasticomyces elasticus]